MPSPEILPSAVRQALSTTRLRVCKDSQPGQSGAVMASTAGSYCVAPYAEFQETLFGKIGLDWERYKIAAPFYSYYFDDRTPGVKAGIVQQLLRCQEEFARWESRDGGPTDPPDASDPKYDYLSNMSLDAYLVRELPCDPIVSDFYTRYTIDSLAGTTKQVNAHSGICFLAAEYSELFAFPGGNAGLARLLVKWLNKDAIPGNAVTSTSVRADTLDRAGNRVRIRQASVVVRADQGSVVYHTRGHFYRARANAIVLACGSHTSQHLVEHLADNPRKESWKRLNTVPVVVANVAVKSAAPFIDAGLGYDQFWWGSKYWADFVIADWATPNRGKRDRRTVLTFFGGNEAGSARLASERFKLLQTPFGDYEQSIREDLSRVMTGSAFDFDRDVTAIHLYRWGHGMIMPTPGHLFGTNGDRTTSPRRIASAPLGMILFAGQETEGTPSVECAMASGERAANEVLAQLSARSNQRPPA